MSNRIFKEKFSLKLVRLLLNIMWIFRLTCSQSTVALKSLEFPFLLDDCSYVYTALPLNGTQEELEPRLKQMSSAVSLAYMLCIFEELKVTMLKIEASERRMIGLETVIRGYQARGGFKVLAIPGSIGPRGPSGPQGSPGNVGAVGPNGSSGPTGYIGSQGLSGQQGATGYQGFTGPLGQAGATGSSGISGATGPPGPMGSVGEKGPIGPGGDKGMPGDTGVQGPFGATGFQGPPGISFG